MASTPKPAKAAKSAKASKPTQAAKPAKSAKGAKGAKVPFDRPRSRYVKVRFADVVEVLAMIERAGGSRKLAGATKGEEHAVRLPAATVVAVKTVVDADPKMARSALGKRVLYARKVAAPKAAAAPRKASPATALAGSSVATGDHDCCGFPSGG